jgi:hypothetical protein
MEGVMPIAEIFAGVSGLKTIMDTLKGFKDIGDANTRNAVAVELQQKILSAYQAQVALTEQIGNLEKEVAQFKNWDTDKNRYLLTDYGGGTFAYALKPEKENGEPPHRICANCYNQGHKSLLQFQHKTFDKRENLICHLCGKETILGFSQKSQSSQHGNSGGSWMAT